MSNHPTIDYPAPPAVPPQGKLPMGSDGHAYDSDVSSIAGYSGTSNLLKLNTGESQTGAVVFQVPNGSRQPQSSGPPTRAWPTRPRRGTWRADRARPALVSGQVR